MSVVVDSNVVAASEPLVDMAETKDVNFESPHGKEINEAAVIGEPDTNNDASNDASKGGDINGVATKGDDKVATPTDNAGAKAADEVSSRSPKYGIQHFHFTPLTVHLKVLKPQLHPYDDLRPVLNIFIPKHTIHSSPVTWVQYSRTNSQ